MTLRVAGFFSEADEHSPLSLPTCLCPCARQQHEKNLSKLSAEFAANLELLRDRYGLPCMCASSPSGLLCVHACHMLYPGSEWGLQVLSVLTQEMELRRGTLVVVLAGDPHHGLDLLLKEEADLRRYFPITLNVPVYTEAHRVALLRRFLPHG